MTINLTKEKWSRKLKGRMCEDERTQRCYITKEDTSSTEIYLEALFTGLIIYAPEERDDIFWCTWGIPQHWHTRRKVHLAKYLKRICGHFVQGKPQTQEKFACGEWSKSTTPTTYERSIWMHRICTTVVWYIFKNSEVTWVCGKKMW